MAYFRKRGSSWYVEIRKNGIAKNATFDRKEQAHAWAIKTEAEIMSEKRGAVPNKTFGDLLLRYSEEVSIKKKGKKWEQNRINFYLRDEISNIKLCKLNESNFSELRDRRLKVNNAATVRRDWALLSGACTVAVDEWLWLPMHPMKKIRLPVSSPSRDKLISESEKNALLFTLGYDSDKIPTTSSARVGAALLFAIETAMRVGEICALRKKDVHLAKRYVCVTGDEIGAGKTRSARRNVPLSTEAVRIIENLPPNDPIFGLKPSIVDALFRKAKAKVLIQDLHFHDTRHTAITQLAKKIESVNCCKNLVR